MTIELPKLDIRHMGIRLIGDSPLICHRWSEKAKKEMLDKQMKKPKQGKKAKDPQKEYLDSLYPFAGGGYGFPVVAFKAAAVDSCPHLDGITKVQARGAFHIDGELVKIDGKPSMREDMVRIGMGVADIRYRGEFKRWRCSLDVRYNANVLSAGQIVNLFNTGGFAVGVGEWRPERNGSYGMFHASPRGRDGPNHGEDDLPVEGDTHTDRRQPSTDWHLSAPPAGEAGRPADADLIAAAEPRNSPLHRLFEWDDTEAARKYREDQARYILRSLVVVFKDEAGGEPKTIRAFLHILGDKESSYCDTVTVMGKAWPAQAGEAGGAGLAEAWPGAAGRGRAGLRMARQAGQG